MHPRKVYLVGSMRNPQVEAVAAALRSTGHSVFDDWISPGPETDVLWREYELRRGRTFTQALAGKHAQDVFEFDKRHIDESDTVILVLPAGKSAHMELGYAIGTGKEGYILLDGEPERYDIMYAFATQVFNHVDEMMAVVGVG